MPDVQRWLRQLVARLVELRERLLDPPAGAYPGPRPDELLLCLLCLLSGIPTLLGAPPQSVVDALLWRPLLYVWAVALVVLPVVIIWTSLARWRNLPGERLISSALTFRWASRLLAIASAVYAITATSLSGWGAAVAAGLAIANALGRLWRSYEMGRWLERRRIA